MKESSASLNYNKDIIICSNWLSTKCTYFDIQIDSGSEISIFAEQVLEHAIMIGNISYMERSSRFQPFCLRFIQIDFH